MENKNTNNSDEGGKRQESESGPSSLNVSNFFQSFRFRYFIEECNGLDRFLLDYNLYFLPVISIFLWSLFLVVR